MNHRADSIQNVNSNKPASLVSQSDADKFTFIKYCSVFIFLLAFTVMVYWLIIRDFVGAISASLILVGCLLSFYFAKQQKYNLSVVLFIGSISIAILYGQISKTIFNHTESIYVMLAFQGMYLALILTTALLTDVIQTYVVTLITIGVNVMLILFLDDPLLYKRTPLLIVGFLSSAFLVNIFKSNIESLSNRLLKNLMIQQNLTERIMASEERFKSAFHGSDIILWDYNITNDTITMSENGFHLFEISPKSKLAHSIWKQMFHPDDLKTYEAKLKRHLERVTPYFEDAFRFYPKEGEEVWFFIKSKVTERDGKGEPLRISGTIRNITERRALNEMLSRYQFMSNVVPDFMTMIDENYRYVAANDAYCEAHNLMRSALIGRTVAEIWGDEKFEKDIKPLLEQANEKGGVDYYGWFVFGKLGKRFMQVSYYPYRNEKGVVSNIVIISRDQTFAHLNEETIKQELAEKTENISHAIDLQNLLNRLVVPEIPHYQINAHYLPSEAFGGDYINIFKTRSNNIIILLADSTGHGLEASTQEIVIKLLCDKYLPIVETGADISKFVSAVNKDIMNYTLDEKYPTLFAGMIDSKTNTLYYANANGELPLFVRGGKMDALPAVRGFHLGYDAATVFETASFQFETGDLLFLFSDAIKESSIYFRDTNFNSKLETLLVKYLNENQFDFVNFLLNLENSFLTNPPNDDVTVATFYYH